MAKIRKINVSETVGNNPPGNAVMPAGTIVVYEDTDNGVTEYLLRVHDGVTDGGVPFASAPSIEHNNDINITVDSGDSSTYTWNFGQTGDLTIPGNIRKTTDASIEVDVGGSLGNIKVWTVDELVPPGGVWRLFIDDVNYPTLGTTVQIGDTVTTSWGTPVTATIVDIQQDSGNWQIHVDQDITAGFANDDTVTFSTVVTTKTWTFSQDGSLQIPGGITGNNDINITVDNDDSSTYTWNFDRTGNLTAPGDITTGLDGVGGRFIQDCADSNTSMRWINVPQGDDTTQLIRAYTGDPKLNTEVERAQIKLNWDETEDKSGLTIRTFNQSNPNNEVDHDWLFKGDGVLQLPVGGDIVDSEGNSVLGSVDNNIWVQTFETASPATDVPQVAVSVEYDSAGNIIALFSHINPVDDSTYYSVGKYTTTGTRIWTTGFADDFNTDGWGLAVDNAGGFVYIAGDTNADGGEDNATLTKINGVTGLVEWSKIYDFGFSSYSSVVDVTSDGDPVMVGFASNGDDRYVATTKVDQTDGSVIWSRALDGQNDEEAYGMAVGPSGEVVAVGYMESFGVQDAAATLYTEPASNPNWTTGVSGPVGGVNFSSVTFTDGVPTFANVSDTLGNRTVDDVLGVIGGNAFGGTSPADDMTVKVATVAANDTDNRMLVVKYAANGTIAWQKAVQFDENFDCNGADADIDSEGNIYVCGQYSADNVGPIGQLMSIVKFNSSGVKQWSRRVVGNCGQWTSSIVVGTDDHLYLSGTTFSGTESTVEDIHLVLAKYGFDGLVEWQRLLDYTAGYSFGSNFFGSDIGGSNLAVKQDYVAVSLGFGSEEDLFGGPGLINAAVAQISATGDIFTVGNWDFKTASFSGTVNSTASDIVVTDAGKTDYDNIANISTTAVTLEEDSSDFLIGTLFTAPGGDNSLVNGVYSVTLENTGTLTLPAGGTITEGYVTSNPTIQLTPASPDVASQKLVIKGGGSYTASDNGIGLNWYIIDPVVNDTVEIYVNSPDNADQTLYWWIYPEGAGIATPESGTVSLGEGGAGNFSFTVDSDDYEFTVRVSPEANNYDPATGVETQLFNSSAPTLDADHHLHLTTGDLAETSIFLGTDNHNVRTTVNGGIEINTFLYPSGGGSGKWTFSENGDLTFPDDTVQTTAYIPGDIRSEGNINIDINLTDSTLRRWRFGEDGDTVFPNNVSINYSGNNVQFPRIIADSGKAFSVQGQGASGSAAMSWTVDPDAAGQYAAVGVSKGGGDNLAKVVLQAQSDSGDAATVKLWKFDETGTLTFPSESSVFTLGTDFTQTIVGDFGNGSGYIRVESNTGSPNFSPAPISTNFYNFLSTLTAGTQFTVNTVVDGTTYNTVVAFTQFAGGNPVATNRNDLYYTYVSGDTLPFSYNASALTLLFTTSSLVITPTGITFPDATVQTTAYIPGDIQSEDDISIRINLSDSTQRVWRFGEDGDLTFPDNTVQTTALVQGEQVFTVDTGSTAYAPTAVDFNLLFVTSAVGYSEIDPTSVTLPNGVPGQRLVIFNGYNLATLTVNPGPVGRDISSGVVAEFIYSGFDGLWIPLYGTNSPT